MVEALPEAKPAARAEPQRRVTPPQDLIPPATGDEGRLGRDARPRDRIVVRGAQNTSVNGVNVLTDQTERNRRVVRVAESCQHRCASWLLGGDVDYTGRPRPRSAVAAGGY